MKDGRPRSQILLPCRSLPASHEGNRDLIPPFLTKVWAPCSYHLLRNRPVVRSIEYYSVPVKACYRPPTSCPAWPAMVLEPPSLIDGQCTATNWKSSISLALRDQVWGCHCHIIPPFVVISTYWQRLLQVRYRMPTKGENTKSRKYHYRPACLVLGLVFHEEPSLLITSTVKSILP
jgi:hypothetical protein